MDKIKLFDSELKVMEVLWAEGELPAKKIAEILNASIGWNKNTTYTVIKKCVEKGIVERVEPNFLCLPLLTKEQAREFELEELITRLYDGSAGLLFTSMLGRLGGGELSEELLAKLKDMAGEQK